MRFVFWGLAALVALALWVRATPAGPDLRAAFAATEARPDGYSLNDWVTVGGSRTDLTVLAKTVGARLGIHTRPVSSRGAGWRKVTLTQTVGSVATRVVAERVPSGSTYVVVDRAASGGFAGLAESRALVARVLSFYGPVHAAVTLEGTLPRPFTPREATVLVDRVFRRMAARRESGVTGRRLVSVAGYVPGWPGSLSLEGRPVNFQCAAVVGARPGTTEVLIGSPVITVTY
jgi:hypothetical protein